MQWLATSTPIDGVADRTGSLQVPSVGFRSLRRSSDRGGTVTNRGTKYILPTLLTVLTVISGMAYSLWWPSVVRHQSFYWMTPGDLWSTVRTAHYVGWGGLSFVYSSRAVFVTLPGFATLLSPVVLLASALHLSESAPGVFLPKPEVWLLVGPFCMIVSSVALFGLDALARHVGMTTSSRRLLLVAEAAALWPATVIWGHPEDAAAVGLLAFAFVAMNERRWGLTGWL